MDSKGNVFVGQINKYTKEHYVFKFSSKGTILEVIPTAVAAYDLQIRSNNSLYFINNKKYYSSAVPKPEKPVNDGFKEMTQKLNTPIDKMWDVTYSLAIDITTIREKNIYVTDAKGTITPVLYVIDRSRSDSKVSIIPVKDYTKGETYTLWIKDIKAEDGKILKENVKMKFTIVK